MSRVHLPSILSPLLGRVVRAGAPFVALAAALAAPASAQTWEDPGPHGAGWVDISFVDASLGEIVGRVYYPALASGQGTPADTSGAPYPLHGFQHGWLGSPGTYDHICNHMATWGYVVASIGTETGIFASPANEAADTQAMMLWAEDQSRNEPGSFLAGMVSPTAPWSASGHSMGGSACQYLVGLEPRIDAVLALQPLYASSGTPGLALAAYPDALLVLAGSIDSVTPPGSNAFPYWNAATSTTRAHYLEVQGMGHLGSTDIPSTSEPVPASEQQRLHRKIMVAFLEAEVRGNENAYGDLLGEGMTPEPVEFEADCEQPPLWARPGLSDPNALVAGLAGHAGDPAILALSAAPASIPTPFGLLGLDPALMLTLSSGPLDTSGVGEASIAVPPGLTGTPFWVQGLALYGGGGQLSATSLFQAP